MYISYGMGLCLYWAFFWRSFLVGLLLALIVKFIPAHILPVAKFFLSSAWLVLLFGSTLYILKIIFNKSYNRFRVFMVDNADGHPIEATFKQLLKLWWSRFWRVYLVFVPVLTAIIMTGIIMVAHERVQQGQYRYCQMLSGQSVPVDEIPLSVKKHPPSDCTVVLDHPPAIQDTKALIKQHHAGLWFVLGFVLSVLYMGKVFQIMLTKHYSDYHIQVTQRD